MNNSLISIIIPTFNRASLIKDTLDSVLLQTHQNWECIVVDDGSTDGTNLILKEYLEKNTRFKYIKNTSKKGAQGARNTGVIESKSEWIVFFDSDNIMKPSFIDKLFTKITNEKVDICTCHSNVVNKDNNQITGSFSWNCYGNIKSDLYKGKAYVDYNGALIKKSKIVEIGLLDEDCPSFQEWDTHLRLSTNSTYTTVEEKLVNYFVGGTDAISYNTKRTIEGYLYILKKHSNNWILYPNEFNNYGNQVYSLIINENDKAFKKQKIEELHKIIPNFKPNQATTKNKIKTWLKTLFKKIYN